MVLNKNLIESLNESTNELQFNREMLKAVELGQDNVLSSLISKGANLHLLQGRQVHKYHAQLDTLLHTAVKMGRKEVVEILLEAGADPNAQNRRMQSPLHYSVYTGDIDIARILLNSGAKIDAFDDDGATVFLWAAYIGTLPHCDFLISQGCNTSIRDAYDYTAFIWAAARGHEEIVNYLREKLSPSESEIKEAVQGATDNGHEKTANFLSEFLK